MPVGGIVIRCPGNLHVLSNCRVTECFFLKFPSLSWSKVVRGSLSGGTEGITADCSYYGIVVGKGQPLNVKQNIG